MDRSKSLLTTPASADPGAAPAPTPQPPAPPGPGGPAGPPEATPPASSGSGAPASSTTRSPAWVRPALGALLLATALLYLWGLGASGWANSFYSAAAQAGSVSWKAFFYGSSDAANSITVDKPPASLWLMGLSVRVFGLNAWAILVPQALAGVASVGVLFATVRRWYGPAAGLLAGAVLAATPVAALMFRFNNPDALLVLLLVLAAYATVRAVETASGRWLLMAGALVGFGFLTKMLQAFLVVPAFAGVYLLAAPAPVLRRIRRLLLAGVGLVVAAGWWVAIVELVPAAARPYVGGSQANSILELTLGYNGLGRITGEQVGSVGGGGGPGGGVGNGGGRWGETGLLRLFGAEMGGQIAWLLPAALILLVAGLVVAGRAPRTDRQRAGFLLWGGWLLVTGLTFSLMQGIIHAYYTVALAPAVGALVGMGATVLWRRRRHPAAIAVLAATLAVTAVWSWRLLDRSADWQPWLRPAILIAGLAAAALLVVATRLPRRFGQARLARWAIGPVLTLGLAAALAGPLGYALDTAATPHAGAIPSAGPAGFGAGFGQGGRGGGPGGGRPPGGFPNGGAQGGGFPNGGAQGGGFPNGGAQGGGRVPGGAQGGAPNGGAQGGAARGGGATGGGGPGAQGGGMGGLLQARTPSAEMVSLLKTDGDRYTWAAAAVGSNNAAGYQLATGDPVMPIGGFNGSDPSPTLAQFQQYIQDGKIHYFIGGGGMRANGGSQAAQEIANWVAENFTASTVDGITVYDLSNGLGG